jgi:hypothetical protein
MYAAKLIASARADTKIDTTPTQVTEQSYPPPQACKRARIAASARRRRPCSPPRRSTCDGAASRPSRMRSRPSIRRLGRVGAADRRPTFASRTGSPAGPARAPSADRPPTRSPPAARVASPPDRLGHRHGSPRDRRAGRRRSRPCLGVAQRRSAFDVGPRHRLRDLVQLHTSPAITGRETAPKRQLKHSPRARTRACNELDKELRFEQDSSR